MGLFQHKQKQRDEGDDADSAELHFFDEYFREELRNHGRWYFQRIIKENAQLFKKDLDATVIDVNNELKDHVVKQLDAALVEVNAEISEHITKRFDDQFVEFNKAVQDAQAAALESLNESTSALQEQHKQIKEAQHSALTQLQKSVESIQEQHQQLSQMLEKSVANQQAMLIDVFEKNMAQVIEHYLLEALGDQYDLKAQVPAIIEQMEANKQAMLDDMKL